jgi:hypothetical protein
MTTDTIRFDASEIFAFAKAAATMPHVIGDETFEGMSRTSTAVQQRARSNLQSAGAVDTHGLLDSIETHVGSWESEIIPTAPWAINVEEGRKAGAKMPPSDPIEAWMARHGIPLELSFVIRRAIGERGIPARPFLKPALEANRTKFEQEMQDAIDRAVGKIFSP